MKIALCSDIHLEFGPISLDNTEGADVLILSGDICVAHDLLKHDPFGLMPLDKSSRYHTFFQECRDRFPVVIYIAGNHEHYHGDYTKTVPLLRERLSYLKNLHVMDKEVMVIDDVVFFAGTLWTDMNKEDPVTMSHIRGVMNDYRMVEDSAEVVNYKVYHTKMKTVGLTDEEWLALPQAERVYVEFKTRPAMFSPQRSVDDHKEFLMLLKAAIDTRKDTHSKFVVVGHHSPSKLSTKPQYEGEFIINGAYSSDLSEFMLDNPQIKMWTHGHTHHPFDYMIGTCRVVCNPRGYDKYEQRADDFELKYFEV